MPAIWVKATAPSAGQGAQLWQASPRSMREKPCRVDPYGMLLGRFLTSTIKADALYTCKNASAGHGNSHNMLFVLICLLFVPQLSERAVP